MQTKLLKLFTREYNIFWPLWKGFINIDNLAAMNKWSL